MVNFIKILIVFILVSVVFSLSIFASDFSDNKDAILSLGISEELIGEENERVLSADANELIFGLTGVKTALSGEFAVTSEYLSAILGLKGYSAENGDFLLEFPYDFAAQVGLISKLPADCYYLTNGIMVEAALAVSPKKQIEFNSNMPEINESGNILGLTSFYCPEDSDNSVVAFFDDGTYAIETKKFTVKAVQGGGEYFADVLRKDAVNLNDLSLKYDSYFAAVSFFGDPITVDIVPKCDISSGYSVYTNKNVKGVTFDGGVLSVSVDQAQILKVVFDGSEGKTLYIFVGNGSEFTYFDIDRHLDMVLIASIPVGSEEVSYVYPLKTIVDNKIEFLDAYLSRGNAYLSSEYYSGEYLGSDAVRYKGDVYIPVSAFANLSDISSALYNSELGLIGINKKEVDQASLGNFKNASATDLTESNMSITFSDNSNTSSKGIFAEISATSLMSADCLKFVSDTSMTGKAGGAKLKLAIVGYNSFGETDVFALNQIRAYNKTYETVSYFDISDVEGEYESFYFVIIIDEEPGVTVTMSDLKLEVFEVSSGIGDNEFNPF